MKRLYGGDISNGQENLSVYIARGVSVEALANFQYSPENVQGPGCDVDPSEVTLPGCSCRTSSCVTPSCPCLRYGPAYTPEGRLMEPPEEPNLCRPVFECNTLCACADSCQSRLVQNGLRIQLGVFQTENRGLGVETLEAIGRGSFVCEYAGEVIGFEEARRRQLSQTPRDRNYIIAVKEHGGSEQPSVTFLDPAAVGNVGRFLNHSCQPNLVMVPVRVHSVVPRLALFARRDIEPGEELSFSYSGHEHRVGAQSEAGGRASVQRKVCLCGSPNCSGFLPLDFSILH